MPGSEDLYASATPDVNPVAESGGGASGFEAVLHQAEKEAAEGEHLGEKSFENQY